MFLTRSNRRIPARTDRFSRTFDRAFTNPFWTAFGELNGERSLQPATDIVESADSVTISTELPGVSKDDVSISLEDGVLAIRGEKKHESKEETDEVRRYERTYGIFQRSFVVSDSIDSDAIDATFENGVLTLTLPKAEKAKPKQIALK